MNIHYVLPSSESPIELQCASIVDALSALKIMGVDTKDIQFLHSSEDIDEWRYSKIDKGIRNLYEGLTKRAKLIYNNVLQLDIKHVSPYIVSMYGLDKKTSSPYYILSYWGHDSDTGKFATAKQVRKEFEAKLTDEDTAVFITVYDAKTGEQINVQMELSISLDEGETWV